MRLLPGAPLQRRQLIAAVLAAAVLLSSFVALAQAPATQAGTPRQRMLEDMRILGSVFERVYYNYIDPLSADSLLDAGIAGLLQILDEHSQYLPPVAYDDLMSTTEGEFGGLGIRILIRDHYPTVVSPIEGTPAFLMGIQGGDQIIEIEGESTYDFSSMQAVKLLRGEPGTKVTITIKREGRDPFPLTITRDIIKVESVPYAFMMGDVGYVRIQNFARTTTSELKAKLADLEKQGARALILDLRWNPGGLLDAACGVSELFLDPGQLIVYTKGRMRDQNRSYYAEEVDVDAADLPTIVMINGSSASASEIVSAALQDHDRGLVVGTTSFGKGSVQTVFPLDEKRALKLTTARYYTPSGRSIHKPRRRDGSLIEPAAVDTAAADTTRPVFHTDAGRVVYGGGGITPDVVITQPLLNDFQVALERDGALFAFATHWTVDHQVPRDVTVDDAMWDAFLAFLAERPDFPDYLADFDLAYSDSLVAANADYIKRGIRRELMRRNFGAQAAYLVSTEEDFQLQETRRLLERATTLQELFDLAAKLHGDTLSVDRPLAEALTALH